MDPRSRGDVKTECGHEENLPSILQHAYAQVIKHHLLGRKVVAGRMAPVRVIKGKRLDLAGVWVGNGGGAASHLNDAPGIALLLTRVVWAHAHGHLDVVHSAATLPQLPTIACNGRYLDIQKSFRRGS